MSQLVAELEELCHLRPSLDFNNASRHQLNSFELFFLVVGSLVVGMLLGVVGVACFKRQVMKMINMLVGDCVLQVSHNGEDGVHGGSGCFKRHKRKRVRTQPSYQETAK